MSRHTRSGQGGFRVPGTPSMLSKVQAEIEERYVEVEAGGLSLARLGCIYLAGAREFRDRVREAMRSIFSLRTAH